MMYQTYVITSMTTGTALVNCNIGHEGMSNRQYLAEVMSWKRSAEFKRERDKLLSSIDCIYSVHPIEDAAGFNTLINTLKEIGFTMIGKPRFKKG
ncbi:MULTISPECIES: hypothetical protein [unclassified Shewanella]|uniref:hypothetical protein n=1 Tax=unclassified Shewanella TaxID=196818 RepID=UPI001BC559FC|nr:MULTISPECIES: hypothetical protein [unclassified Shewanella]GIU07641.1 hypothetical protein TUM4444_07390 [Shewanella sp. MBTL60-112-B1]GIU30246.1 hypothetical protein TUM4445_13380 [Shewanella sp. MBTL60-112-B2]